MFAIVLVVAGGSIFGALNARRATITSPSISAPMPSGSGVIAPPPDLVIPPDFDRRAYQPVAGYPFAEPAAEGPAIVSAAQDPRPSASISRPVSAQFAQPQGYQIPPPLPATPSPGYVYQAAAPPATAAPGPANSRQNDQRARASRFSNPATTVPQGTVMQAVLETALNSNHPGFARAVISRDVSSFDGSHVLIPKGSKLFGEYKADLSYGQNRALIQWRRLMRPDGSTIDVDSPTADPLGRAGVKGKVDTHFFERFGGAILQSVLDAGVQLATREAAGDTVVLSLPNNSQTIATRSEDIRPTIKVRQGTSVSVFVGRDLDFTDVEG
jgi:type IV secretion system protein VirB10